LSLALPVEGVGSAALPIYPPFTIGVLSRLPPTPNALATGVLSG
jgi:hypothetical protein